MTLKKKPMSDLDYMQQRLTKGAQHNYTWPCGQSKPAPGQDLTPQETKVLRLIVRGLSNAQVAKIIGCKEGTIKTHLTVIYVKYGVRNRVEATRKFYDIKDTDGV